WLVFADAEGLGRALVRRLDGAGCQAIMVLIGKRFERLDDRVYTIDPRRPEDYQALFDELPELPEQIVHLWSVVASAGPAVDVANFEAAQERGFYSLLLLAQALGRRERPAPAQLNIITSRAHSVS